MQLGRNRYSTAATEAPSRWNLWRRQRIVVTPRYPAARDGVPTPEESRLRAWLRGAQAEAPAAADAAADTAVTAAANDPDAGRRDGWGAWLRERPAEWWADRRSQRAAASAPSCDDPRAERAAAAVCDEGQQPAVVLPPASADVAAEGGGDGPQREQDEGMESGHGTGHGLSRPHNAASTAATPAASLTVDAAANPTDVLLEQSRALLRLLSAPPTRAGEAAVELPPRQVAVAHHARGRPPGRGDEERWADAAAAADDGAPASAEGGDATGPAAQRASEASAP